ncbi:MAG: hypothetical protein NTW29_04990 [Bacteroidetes bacterium]|nr:hypothetical protein [Bacteroidota bacterium]
MLTPEENEYSDELIRKALQGPPLPGDPVEELIATGKAIFILMRHSKADPELKKVFYQLEKQFLNYADQLKNRKRAEP